MQQVLVKVITVFLNLSDLERLISVKGITSPSQKYNLLMGGSSPFHPSHQSIISPTLFCVETFIKPFLSLPLCFVYASCCGSFLSHLLPSCLLSFLPQMKPLDPAAEIKMVQQEFMQMPIFFLQNGARCLERGWQK